MWQLLKLHIKLPCDSAIQLLGIYSGEIKMYVHKITCIGVFIALFIITNKWKQSKCPSADYWINKMYIHIT